MRSKQVLAGSALTSKMTGAKFIFLEADSPGPDGKMGMVTVVDIRGAEHRLNGTVLNLEWVRKLEESPRGKR